MDLQKQKNALVRAGYWTMIAAALYALARYALPFALPFLWGFAIAWLLRPVVGFIRRHSGMGGRGAAIVSTLALYTLLGLLCWLLISLLVVWGEAFFARLPEMYSREIAPLIDEAGRRLGVFARRFARSGAEARAGGLLQAMEQALAEMAASLSAGGMRLLGAAVQGLPKTALKFVFTLLSSVFVSMDYEAVTGFIAGLVPDKYRQALRSTRSFLMASLRKLLKAYGILAVITFLLVGAGLAVLRVENFVGWAALVAVVDLLPVIGSGSVLVPWGVYTLLGGEYFTGAGLLLLWVVAAFVREVLEPKLVGDQIGLHPLASLIAIYVGLRVAGVWGLLAAPILCLLLAHLWKAAGKQDAEDDPNDA